MVGATVALLFIAAPVAAQMCAISSIHNAQEELEEFHENCETSPLYDACTQYICVKDPVPVVPNIWQWNCVFGPLSCDDNNACSTDSCDPVTGCANDPIDCGEDESDECVINFCDPQTGCFQILTECTDGDQCTDDDCDPVAGCDNTPTVCNDNNVCTTDSCNPQVGCQFFWYCDDNDQCTDDMCDPLTGTCDNQYECVDDGNACTDEYCDPGSGCAFGEPVQCNDNNVCTFDNCDPLNGCMFVPIGQCDDNDVCTLEHCDPLTGCVFDGDMNCNDGKECTTDSCIPGTGPGTGCLYVADGCDDNNVCTEDSCDQNGDCTYSPVSCADDDLCSTEACIPGTGPGTGCVYTPVSCVDNFECTEDSCDPNTGNCIHEQMDCSDDSVCTFDECVEPGEGETEPSCMNLEIPCNDNDGEPCGASFCHPQFGCQYVQMCFVEEDCPDPGCADPQCESLVCTLPNYEYCCDEQNNGEWDLGCSDKLKDIIEAAFETFYNSGDTDGDGQPEGHYHDCLQEALDVGVPQIAAPLYARQCGLDRAFIELENSEEYCYHDVCGDGICGWLEKKFHTDPYETTCPLDCFPIPSPQPCTGSVCCNHYSQCEDGDPNTFELCNNGNDGCWWHVISGP